MRFSIELNAGETLIARCLYTGVEKINPCIHRMLNNYNYLLLADVAGCRRIIKR